MNKINYEALVNYFSRSKARMVLLFIMCKVCPILIGLIYLWMAVMVLFVNPYLLMYFLTVPLGTLIIVSLMRHTINKKRPYEALKYQPLMKKYPKSGQSFPSRHAASAFVIAVSCMYFDLGLGLIVLLLAILATAARVCAGLHYIIDVIAGMIMGIFAAVFFVGPLIF